MLSARKKIGVAIADSFRASSPRQRVLYSFPVPGRW